MIQAREIVTMMKKIHKRREFLHTDEESIAAIQSSMTEEMKGVYYAHLELSEREVGFVINTHETAEEAMLVLAKIEDHVRSLRNEIINLKFDQNKQTNETV